MTVVSRGSRKKSWRDVGEVVNLLEAMAAKESEVSERLERLRRAHGMSQEAAAHHVGVTSRQWQRWASGASEPRASNLARISEKFGVPIGEIVGTGSGSQFDRIETQLLEQAEALSRLEDQIRLLRADLAIQTAEDLRRTEESAAASPPARLRQQR